MDIYSRLFTQHVNIGRFWIRKNKEIASLNKEKDSNKLIDKIHLFPSNLKKVRVFQVKLD